MDEVFEAFAAECGAASAVLQATSAADFTTQTNCPPWTLSELVIHMAGNTRIADFAEAPENAPKHAAADYYRRPERGTMEYRQHNVARVQQQARAVLAERSATDYFVATTRSTIEEMCSVGPARLIAIPGVGAMTVAQWATTRVIAVAAHGRDVAITLGRAAWTTEAVLRLTRPVFVALLGAEPPTSLGWDSQSFFDASTGRRRLTEPDRRVLDSAATKFPLLS